MSFSLPDLPYPFNALEPHIDTQTMQIHHDKHHGGYVDKLNAAIKDHPDYQSMEINQLLRQIDTLPDEIITAVRNNGGGHANHTLFWKIMTPDFKNLESGSFLSALNSQFSNLDNFKQQFTEIAISRFGSGWAWLVVNKKGDLDIISTPNQDSPLMEGHTPVLGLDVWEHAYYLKYQNKRPDYIQAWWNVINWTQVEENFSQITSK